MRVGRSCRLASRRNADGASLLQEKPKETLVGCTACEVPYRLGAGSVPGAQHFWADRASTKTLRAIRYTDTHPAFCRSLESSRSPCQRDVSERLLCGRLEPGTFPMAVYGACERSEKGADGFVHHPVRVIQPIDPNISWPRPLERWRCRLLVDRQILTGKISPALLFSHGLTGISIADPTLFVQACAHTFLSVSHDVMCWHVRVFSVGSKRVIGRSQQPAGFPDRVLVDTRRKFA